MVISMTSRARLRGQKGSKMRHTQRLLLQQYFPRTFPERYQPNSNWAHERPIPWLSPSDDPSHKCLEQQKVPLACASACAIQPALRVAVFAGSSPSLPVVRHGKFSPSAPLKLPPPWLAKERVDEPGANHGK